MSLRDRWSRRWRQLPGWQRALSTTLLGGFALNYGLPAAEAASRSLSTFSQIALVGVVLVSGLFAWTRRRIAGLETVLTEHLGRVAVLQFEALVRLEDLTAAVTGTTPDGGRRSSVAATALADGESRRRRRADGGPSLAVALLGGVAGVLVGVGAGLGPLGSPPVLATTLVGGLAAVTAVDYWRPGDDSGSPDGDASSLAGSGYEVERVGDEIRVRPAGDPERGGDE